MFMILNLSGDDSGITAEVVKYGESNVGAALSTLENELTANGQRIYLDYKDGKYGYNTSPLRGADTFSPFSSGGSDWELVSDNLNPIEGGRALGVIFEVNDKLYLYNNNNKSLYQISVPNRGFLHLKTYSDLEFYEPTICKVNGNIYFYFTNGRGIYSFNVNDYSLTYVASTVNSFHCVYTDNYIYEVGSFNDNSGYYFRRYDPVTNTWTQLASSPMYVNINSYVYGSAFTYNNEVYVQANSAIHKYDAVNNKWVNVGTFNSGTYRTSYYKKYVINNELHLIGGVNYVSGTYYYGNVDLKYDSKRAVFEYHSPAFNNLLSIFEGVEYTYLLTRTDNMVALYKLKR